MGDERYALGVEIRPGGPPLLSEVGLMEQLSESMYEAAAELRRCDRPVAASAVEWGALHLLNEAEQWRPHLRAEREAAEEATTS